MFGVPDDPNGCHPAPIVDTVRPSFGLVRACNKGEEFRMTLPASAGVWFTSSNGTPECDPAHRKRTMCHNWVTRTDTTRGKTSMGTHGVHGDTRSVATCGTAQGTVRRPVMEGVVDRRAPALLATEAAVHRGRPLAGRRPTVLKSCVGVASQRGCVPVVGMRGADPAPVWRKC